MKKTYLMAMTAALLCLPFIQPASAAPEASSFPKVELRSGPNAEYPVVERIERGERVAVYGCLRAWDWCDVASDDGHRGWVSTTDLHGLYDNRNVSLIEHGQRTNIPVVNYDQREYYTTHYRQDDILHWSAARPSRW